MPSKIAFVLPHLNAGGVEVVVMNLLLHLDREAFEPQLVLLHHRGSLLERLPQDVNVQTLDIRAMRSVPRLRALLRRERPDVVFSGTMAVNVASILAVRGLEPRPALIVNEHTPPALYLAEARWGRLRRFLMRRLYPKATAVGVPSEDLCDALSEALRTSELRCVALPNPVFDAALEERASAPLPDNWPDASVFVAAGRLIQAKGFDLLLRALRRIEYEGDPPHLWILGDGPERDALRELAEQLGLSDRVHLAGQVPDPYPFFRSARAMVAPSRRDATPNVLVEAMACGTPVIASECWPGMTRLLDAGSAGILFPVGDIETLAVRMAEILANDELTARLRVNGLAAAKRYRVDRAVPEYERLFDRCAGRRRGPTGLIPWITN